MTSPFDALMDAIEAQRERASVAARMKHLAVKSDGTSFTWVCVGDIVHAFRGRSSFCQSARLPRNWLKLGRRGAVCMACSRALRERGLLRQILK